jgi:SAM-dependent methyltransferase
VPDVSDDLFDRPAAMRLDAVDRLGLRGEERLAGLVTGAGYPDALAPIARALGGVAGLLCDVGAGLGAASAHLAAVAGIPTVGVEPEAHTAGLARRAFPGLPMAAASADAVPFSTGACAAVTLLGTTSLLADLDAVLTETARVLAPGGLLGVSDLGLVPGATEPPEGPNHFRTTADLAGALTARGFVVQDVWEAPADLATRWDAPAQRVDDEIARRHGGSEAYRTWRADRDRLGDLIADGRLGLTTLVARAQPA